MEIDVHRRNKRVEQISSAFMNLGTALAAATAVRLFDRVSFDWSSAIWSVTTIGLIWFGLKVLDLLEQEI